MTAITIERELLEQALVALSAPNHCVFSEPPICVDIRAALAAPATAPEFPANWAQMIHYPECWDTAAYPELRYAIHEALAWSGCSVCKPSTAPERKPMPILEVNARWEQSVLGITRLQYYQVVREVEAFHGITGGKP